MAKTFGVTFAIGAKVNPTVASAFATVEQKVRASQSKMRELTEKAKVLAAANEAKQRVVAAQKVLAQSGAAIRLRARCSRTLLPVSTRPQQQPKNMAWP